MPWQSMDNAPRQNKPFLAVNHDGEIWVAKYDEDDRLCYRQTCRQTPECFHEAKIDGKTVWVRDIEFAKRNEHWRTTWVLWSNGYDFEPTHWMHFERPPNGCEPEQKCA